jgi:transglutaminase-like putative cysteine protease
MARLKTFLTKIACFLLILTILPTTPVSAASDFEIVSGYDVDYRTGNDYITIAESVEFIVYTQDYYIPAGTVQTFLLQDYGLRTLKGERQFKLDSLKVIGQYGTELKYEKVTKNDGIEIRVPLTLRVDYRNSYKIIIEYKTHELVNANGNIVNLYVPGLSENTEFEDTDNGLTTDYIYKATVTTDGTLPSPSYLQPSTITRSERQGDTVYSIPQADRVGHTSWLQLGSNQYYYFKISQKTPKTDNLIPTELSKLSPLLSSNVYKLALPREFDENQQKVYFKNISPAPQAIERDQEGNLIATFSVPANKESEIVIEGYISLFKSPVEDGNIPESMTLSEYSEAIDKEAELEKYLSDDRFWETDSETVNSTAAELLEGETDLLSVIRKDYNHIVDRFSYDPEKIEEGNPRLGAHAALNGSDTICMEYADSLIAILRAQGIAARAAIGYGNDPTGAENRISNDEPLEQTIGHQWVQVWIPGYGWLSVDPTWGESDRTYIGTDLDHILWYTVGDNDQAVAETVVYSSNFVDSGNLEDHQVYIQALNSESEEEITSYDTSEKILERYEADQTAGVSLFLQTSPMGRIIVFLIPIAVICTASVLLSLLVKSLHRRLLVKK